MWERLLEQGPKVGLIRYITNFQGAICVFVVVVVVVLFSLISLSFRVI